MRLLELLIVLALTLRLLARFAPLADRPRWMSRLAWLTVILTLAHLAIEGYRWQMVPAYALAAAFAIRSLRASPRAATPSRWRLAGRIATTTAGLLAVALSCLLAAGLPVFSAPRPSGPYGVGTTRLYFVDRAREDPFAPVAHSPRELLAAVWYPARIPPGARPDPFWPTDARIQQAIGLPDLFFSHVPRVRSHSYAAAPISPAESRYPVVIFSHGYGGSIWQNVPQMEELASHGFIVVSLGHTYDATAITFPDGRVAVGNSGTRVPPPTRENWSKIKALAARMETAAPNPPEARRLWKELLALQRQAGWVVPASVPVWIADTQFLIDQLERINGGDAVAAGDGVALAGRMDLARLGVAGMSFGGSTAGSVCTIDPRCKAGLNLDGWQFGDAVDHPLTVPFMYFANETNAALDGAYYDSKADLYSLHVRRSTHGNFTDLSLVAPLFTWLSTPSFAMLGRIDGDQIERIMSTYSLAFFARHLKDTPQPLLTSAPSPRDFPDLVYRWRASPPAP